MQWKDVIRTIDRKFTLRDQAVEGVLNGEQLDGGARRKFGTNFHNLTVEETFFLEGFHPKDDDKFNSLTTPLLPVTI